MWQTWQLVSAFVAGCFVGFLAIRSLAAVKRFEEKEIAMISLRIAAYRAKDEQTYKRLKSEFLTLLNNEKASVERVSTELKDIFGWVKNNL